MSDIKKLNGRMEITPRPERLGGVNPAELGDEAVNLNQAKGFGLIKPYRKYLSLITQSGTNAPTATIIENTLGVITWARSSAGNYTATLTGAFTAGKTVLYITAINAQLPVSAYRSSADVIQVKSGDGAGGLGDDALENATFEIRVYQ